jgi:hypothetical protein
MVMRVPCAVSGIIAVIMSKYFRVMVFKAVPWLRRLAAGLPPRRPEFDPWSVHVGLVVDKVALRQVFPRILRVSSVNFIPPVLHY